MSIQTALTSTVSLSEVTTLIIEYVRTILEWELISRYGQEIFGILILCTITIFRREISCSGDYKEICDDDDDFAPSIARSITLYLTIIRLRRSAQIISADTPCLAKRKPISS